MTVKQIRSTKFECDDGAWESAKWLQEIAAQLAEVNERNAELVKYIMKEQEEAKQRRIPIPARIFGRKKRNAAHSPTRPHPDGARHRQR